MKTTNKLITAGIFLSMMFVLAFLIPGIVNAQYYNYNNYNNTICTYHSYEGCNGNYLYWYDSCENPQDAIQNCPNGCYNNSCQNYNNYNYNYNYNNYNNCTYHAYKLCVGNAIYWYNSCNTQQDLFYNCAINGQTCQYGQCVTYIQPVQPIQPISNYVAYYKTACSGSSIYWYDSLGVRSGLYKNCQDTNSCTTDACSAGKCSNTLKCDGSTCAVGSANYNTYCATAQTNSNIQTNPTASTNNQNQCGNGQCEPALGETTANCPNDCKTDTNTNANTGTTTTTNANANGLTISFFTKQDSNSNQWQKTAQVGSNGQIYFMISATNNSAAQIDNVNISANIPNDIYSLGNLQLNGVPFSGDIVSGINIGSIAPGNEKSISFEGRTQTISAAASKQAVATSNVSGVTKSDSISINLNPAQSQAAAAVSNTSATSGALEFLKRWYLWIFIGLVLIFLFIIVFKRLSSNV